MAVEEMEVVLALTFDYGQMASQPEIRCSRALSAHYKVPHKVIDLRWFNDFSRSALNQKQVLPVDREISIDDVDASSRSAQKVWVPNRNGIFLNVAAGYAEGLEAEWVIPGFNKEEAQTFPDNSENFMAALNESFRFSTAGPVRVKCFTAAMDKSRIVAEGLKRHLDFSTLWPCYQDQKHWCGSCESCQRFRRALKNQNLDFEEWRFQGGE